MLAEIWFVLFIVIVAGYLILDGFDMGVGILHLPLARTDVERRTFLNSIGPFWDGNAVWLVLAAACCSPCSRSPTRRCSRGSTSRSCSCSFVMILRTVALEFRSKEASPRWRSFWDAVFAARFGRASRSCSASRSGTSSAASRSTRTAT